MHIPNSAIYLDACERGLIEDKVAHNRGHFPQINGTKMDDTSYKLINKLIFHIQIGCFLPHSLETRAKLDIEKGVINISAKCPHCGTSRHCEVIFCQTNWSTWTIPLLQLGCTQCYGKFVGPIDEIGQAIFTNEAMQVLKRHRLKLVRTGQQVCTHIEQRLAEEKLAKSLCKGIVSTDIA